MNASQRLLVIDDTEAIHDDFRKIFAPSGTDAADRAEADFFGGEIPRMAEGGFALEFAFQGAEGCALLERAVVEGREPALAFVDVRMPPGMDGIETAERLWQISPELQVVICTAYSDYSWQEMVARCSRRDRLLILKKPFAGIEVLQLACALGEKWELAQQARDRLEETERIVVERTRELLDEMARRKEAEQHLLRAQRLESIGMLASGMAHELNNMLSPILLSAELLHQEWPAATREQFVRTIETSARRAAGVVRQVLTFARGIDGERRLLQPKRLVREIEKIIGETFPKGIAIESDLDDDLWLIEGDATQLHQVLLNLCVNARDAMSAGGTLRLAAENFEADASYASMRAEATPGRYVRLHISDTGSGIPRELIDKIFDPFFTTKPTGQGSGLGLSTAAGIVKSHEGFINVMSEPGQGTLFEIFLPAARANASDATGKIEAMPVDGRGELILVVDDEEEIRNVTEAVLAQHGYRTMSAADGAEALTSYARERENISAVITDMMMPVVDGIALSRALKTMNPAVRIIAASGHMAAARAKELDSLNVCRVLDKPFCTNALLGALHDALAPRPFLPRPATVSPKCAPSRTETPFVFLPPRIEPI